MIIIEEKQESFGSLQMTFPYSIIIDVSSKAKSVFAQLSPEYLHDGIPVPNSGWLTANSVEGIWQGLKVFEKEDIDRSCFEYDSINNQRRTTLDCGKMLGHRFGTNGIEILNHTDAERRIFIPTYRWVLDYKLQDVISYLRNLNNFKTIVLFDGNFNDELDNCNDHISHVYLLKAYLEGLPPYDDVYETIKHYHCYVGRGTISYETEERRIKEMEPYVMPQQLEFPFDYS